MQRSSINWGAPGRAAAGLAVFGALAPALPARAAIIRNYNVGDIAIGTVAHQVPAINNLGQISFLGGGGVSVWNGSAVVQLPAPGVTGFKANTAINDSGVVAFTNGLAEYTTSAGGSLVTVASPASLPPGTIVSSPSINNAGTVVFTGGTYPFGTTGAISLFRGSTSIASIGNYDLGEISPRPSINTAGAIVITGRAIGGQRTGVYFATDSGLTPITTSNSFGDAFGDAAINARGAIAVAHSPLTGTKQLLVGATAPPPVYADSTGSFATFQDETGYSDGNVSLNATGDLAFLAYTKPYNGFASGGIFTGTDPAQDAIVRAGDPLDGSTIAQLDFGPFGLNDAGQVTFWAKLADGRTGVYLATPVPEPSGTAAVAIAGVACTASRRRSRKSVAPARA
jgi:hypothetical protein